MDETDNGAVPDDSSDGRCAAAANGTFCAECDRESEVDDDVTDAVGVVDDDDDDVASVVGLVEDDDDAWWLAASCCCRCFSLPPFGLLIMAVDVDVDDEVVAAVAAVGAAANDDIAGVVNAESIAAINLPSLPRFISLPEMTT